MEGSSSSQSKHLISPESKFVVPKRNEDASDNISFPSNAPKQSSPQAKIGNKLRKTKSSSSSSSNKRKEPEIKVKIANTGSIPKLKKGLESSSKTPQAVGGKNIEASSNSHSRAVFEGERIKKRSKDSKRGKNMRERRRMNEAKEKRKPKNKKGGESSHSSSSST